MSVTAAEGGGMLVTNAGPGDGYYAPVVHEHSHQGASGVVRPVFMWKRPLSEAEMPSVCQVKLNQRGVGLTNNPYGFPDDKGYKPFVTLGFHDEKDEDEMSDEELIFYAAKVGKVGDVRRLLDKGIKIETRTTILQTPLTWAVMYNQTAVVKLLIERKANLNHKDEDKKHNMTPLMRACDQGSADALKILLAAGADTKVRITESNNEDVLGLTAMGIAELAGEVPESMWAALHHDAPVHYPAPACQMLLREWEAHVRAGKSEAKAAEWKAEAEKKVKKL